jgi:hypothetical protein
VAERSGDTALANPCGSIFNAKAQRCEGAKIMKSDDLVPTKVPK